MAQKVIPRYRKFVWLLHDCSVPFQAAQRLVMEQRTRTIGEQLDELRRHSENLANTQKMVEDVIKRKRKRK